VNNKIRLLLSARDPGAARTIAPIVTAASARPEFQVMVAAQGTAVEIFAGLGIPTVAFEAPELDSPSAPGRDRLLAAAAELLARCEPDVIATGLSGPGIGIDEALIALAGGRPTYSVQDSRGWVTAGFGRPAGTYFVADAEAVEATRRNAAPFGGVRPIIVGSLKHALYAGLDPSALRRQGRSALGDQPSVAFYGQPAWGWAGYRRSLETIAWAMAITPPGPQLVYRPHPKETTRQRADTLAVLERARARVLVDPNADVETSLCAVDLALTCFSACGEDLIHLQRRSTEPLGAVVYVLTEPDLRATLAADTGSPLPWPARRGLARVVTENHPLPAVIAEAIGRDARRVAWEHIQRKLEPAAAAPDRALDVIAVDIGQAAG